MPRRIRAPRDTDAAQLREELNGNAQGVTVEDPDAEGVVYVNVPDEVDGPLLDHRLRRHFPRALVARVRQATTLAQMRDALGDCLEALARRL